MLETQSALGSLGLVVTSSPAVLQPGQFCLPGNFWQCVETFSGVAVGKWYYWHLVGPGQDGAKHTLLHRTPHTRPYPAPDVNSTGVGNTVLAFLEVPFALTLKKEGLSHLLSTTESVFPSS